MLKRYDLMDEGLEPDEAGAWVLYKDAAALELRIRELEQRLMTEAEKRAAFEKDCG